jgi:hypothetical protein
MARRAGVGRKRPRERRDCGKQGESQGGLGHCQLSSSQKCCQGLVRAVGLVCGPKMRGRLLPSAIFLLLPDRLLLAKQACLPQQLAVDRLAPVVDAGRARFRAVGEHLKQIGQLRIAVLLHELRNAVAPAPTAGLADNRERRLPNVGQGDRAVAGHYCCGLRLAVEKLASSVDVAAPSRQPP